MKALLNFIMAVIISAATFIGTVVLWDKIYASPIKQILPGDFVYCQMKDEVVGDYWIGRVQYTSEDGFVLRGGHVPLIPANNEYGLHEPFNDWLMINNIECFRPLYE